MIYCAARNGQLVTDMESIDNKMRSYKRAFTLVEILAALTVGTMVLLAVLALYNRGQSGSAAVINKMESNRLPREVFQRIAEDLDRVAGGDQGTQIDILNKLQDGLSAAKLEIFRPINDAKDQQQTLEKIVWQSSTDPESGLLTLYRSHSGIAMEDALLDNQKEPWQTGSFIILAASRKAGSHGSVGEAQLLIVARLPMRCTKGDFTRAASAAMGETNASSVISRSPARRCVSTIGTRGAASS